MFKAAAEGYIVYAHFWVGLEQMASTLHLDIQNERGWRTARERNYLAMELPRTHAQLFCERIHVKLLFVHKADRYDPPSWRGSGTQCPSAVPHPAVPSYE